MSFIARCDYCNVIAPSGTPEGSSSYRKLPEGWKIIASPAAYRCDDRGDHWCGECNPASPVAGSLPTDDAPEEVADAQPLSAFLKPPKERP